MFYRQVIECVVALVCVGRIDSFEDHSTNDYGNVFNIASFRVCKYIVFSID